MDPKLRLWARLCCPHPGASECWSSYCGASARPPGPRSTRGLVASSELQCPVLVSSGGKRREAQATSPGKGDLWRGRCLLLGAFLHLAAGSMEKANPAASFWASGLAFPSPRLTTPAVWNSPGFAACPPFSFGLVQT